jgi:hypothetical protein
MFYLHASVCVIPFAVYFGRHGRIIPQKYSKDGKILAENDRLRALPNKRCRIRVD